MVISMKKSEPSQDNEVSWTPDMPDRRIADRRENSNVNSDKVMTVPDVQSGKDRRKGNDRRKVKLTITGRAQEA